MATDGKCPLGEHSMVLSLLDQISERLKEAKDTDEKTATRQWEQIAKKVSNKTIMWGCGILLILMMAAVGFLWHNQSSNRTEILTEVKGVALSITGKDGLSEKVITIGTRLDDHLAKGNHQELKKEEKK